MRLTTEAQRAQKENEDDLELLGDRLDENASRRVAFLRVPLCLRGEMSNHEPVPNHSER